MNMLAVSWQNNVVMFVELVFVVKMMPNSTNFARIQAHAVSYPTLLL